MGYRVAILASLTLLRIANRHGSCFRSPFHPLPFLRANSLATYAFALFAIRALVAILASSVAIILPLCFEIVPNPMPILYRYRHSLQGHSENYFRFDLGLPRLDWVTFDSFTN